MTSLTLANTTSAPLDLAAALAALERGGAITPVSLDLEDPEMSYEAWIGLGEVFRRVRGASSWWIGDWYIFGCMAEKNIGERRAAAAESVVGLSAHTLATITRTCMYVPKRQRNLNLPFSHHTEVARLMPEEQVKWLALAERGDGRSSWSREQLREAIRFASKRYSETEPRWEGAVAMKRDNDVIDAARHVWTFAVAEGDHFIVPRHIMMSLGEALGQVLESTEEGVAA